MQFEPGIFQKVILALHQIVHARTRCRRLELGRLFQLELVGHIFAFQLEAALGVVAGDVSVEHRAQHPVIPQADTHPLPDFEGRGVHR